jgi:Polysaccharide lyase
MSALLLALVAAAATAATLLVLAAPRDAAPDAELVRLDFDTGDLSQYDMVQRAGDDRLRVVEAPTREGPYAARFEVRAGDTQEATTGIRAELIAEHDGGRKATAGDDRWYRWSTLFAEDYPLIDEWQTFVQWKNDGTGSPPLAMTVQDDEIRLSGGEQNGFHLYWRAPIERGRWHDFVAHVRWSPDPDTGLVELWHDGRRVVPATRTVTMYRDELGRAIPNYLKIGLYRSSAITQPQVLYHDGVLVASSRRSVERGGNG